MTFVEWIIQYKWVLLAYLILAIIVYINRKKFIVESKIFLLYKTKHGVGFINNFAEKHKEFVKTVGYSAIGIGFLGMLIIIGFFIKGLYDLFFVPGAPPTVSLAIPGVAIPGSPITIPFVYGILALFIVVLFHEFGHGIVARANGIKIKSTGVGLLGPLPLAFVEPDEKQLVKESSVVQNSIFAAGPFMNIVLFGIFFLLCTAVFIPLTDTMSHTDGVSFNSISPGLAADKAGMQKDIVYVEFNNVAFNDTTGFLAALTNTTPGQAVSIKDINGKTSVITLGANPKNESSPYLGVIGVQNDYIPNSGNWLYQAVYYIVFFFAKLTLWVYLLSLGIGLANLLPLGPVDGGRMLNIALIDINGKEKGTKWWAKISWITLFVLIILLVIPILRSLLFKA